MLVRAVGAPFGFVLRFCDGGRLRLPFWFRLYCCRTGTARLVVWEGLVGRLPIIVVVYYTLLLNWGPVRA